MEFGDPRAVNQSTVSLVIDSLGNLKGVPTEQFLPPERHTNFKQYSNICTFFSFKGLTPPRTYIFTYNLLLSILINLVKGK